MLSSPTQQEQAEDIDIQINLEEQSLLKLARTSNEVDRVAYWGKNTIRRIVYLEQIWHQEKAMTIYSGYELGINSKQRKMIIQLVETENCAMNTTKIH